MLRHAASPGPSRSQTPPRRALSTPAGAGKLCATWVNAGGESTAPYDVVVEQLDPTTGAAVEGGAVFIEVKTTVDRVSAEPGWHDCWG